MDEDQDRVKMGGQEGVQKTSKNNCFQNRPGTFGICFGLVARVNEGA